MRLLCLAFILTPCWSQSPDWQAGIVQVSAKGKTPGTGFVVALRSGRAYIVTCAHVIEGDASPMVTFRVDPEDPHPAIVRPGMQGGRKDGLAVLMVDKAPSGALALEIAATTAGADAEVVIPGYPASVGGWTILRARIVSVLGAELFLSPATDEGFSGAPVIRDGQVAGVVFGHGTYGRAVPSGVLEVYLRGLELPRPEPRIKTRINPVDGSTYVFIPPGSFMMGCSPGDNECYEDEKPPHTERIVNGFWLGQTEVTQAAWKKVNGGANPSHFKGDRLPVESVDWNQANAYCKAIGGRLPTEKEWEYAARAGTTGPRYGELEAVAWHDGNSGSTTHPVASKHANAFGLYDMLGNVVEWTSDNYGSGRKVLRGGSWYSNPRLVRASYRNWGEPVNRYNFIGVRCVGGSP